MTIRTEWKRAMIPEQHRMERLSKAYIHAVAAKAGVTCNVPQEDYGIDGDFRIITDYTAPNGKLRRYPALRIDFQLKASTNWEIEDNLISYELESDTYNLLVRIANEPNCDPCMLILYCLPKNRDEWLDLNEERLILKKCCYYAFVRGEETQNKRTKTIKIPRSRLLTPEKPAELFDTMKRRGLR